MFKIGKGCKETINPDSPCFTIDSVTTSILPSLFRSLIVLLEKFGDGFEQARDFDFLASFPSSPSSPSSFYSSISSPQFVTMASTSSLSTNELVTPQSNLYCASKLFDFSSFEPFKSNSLYYFQSVLFHLNIVNSQLELQSEFTFSEYTLSPRC